MIPFIISYSRIKALLLCLLLIIVLTYGLVLKVSYMLAGMVLLVCVVTSFLVPFRLADRARTQNRAYEQVPQQVYGQNAAAQEYVLGINLNHLRLIMTDRDFDANDYEDLLRLDEGLDASHGLAQQQIERYPRSVFKATDSKKAAPTCSICLEALVDGDEIRTVPCMHSFHVDCIDKWLRNKPNCPVCLFPVQQSQDLPAEVSATEQKNGSGSV
uniref:RING-type domain-containing protein n=1 Tax=Lotharella oceanica TaxID=641309 RepID=A0A7S2THW1_9EUKA|mmetsp:Transcript_14612/g.27724  ORF Transcript_14612/g.27724 Transcript_14612/m.27724 type:complete len:214 (+) Transcript_14612:137-778(+)